MMETTQTDPGSGCRSPQRYDAEREETADRLAVEPPDLSPEFARDLREAASLARRRLSRFITSPENAEAVAHVLDGSHRGKRDADAQGRIETFLSELLLAPPELNFAQARSGNTSARIAGNVLPPGIDAAIVHDGVPLPTILVLEQLGFRNVLLVAQAAVLHAVAALAVKRGIGPNHDRVAEELRALVQLSDSPSATSTAQVAGTPPRPRVIPVILDGQHLEGVAV